MKKKILHVVAVLTVAAVMFVACSKSPVDDSVTFVDETTENSTLESTAEATTEEQLESTKEDTTKNDATVNETESTTQNSTVQKPTTQGTTTQYNGVVKPITMAFTGDMYFSDKLYSYYTASGVNGFMSEKVANNFKNVDMMVCNHEYASTDLPDSAKDTRQLYNFKAPTAYEKIWNDLGVDLVSIANNHAMDYGEQSLLDTMAALDNHGIPYIGAGKNLNEAKSANITYVNGKKVAILAATRFILAWDWYAQENKPGLMTTYEGTDRFDMIKAEIKRLKDEEKCDIVAVFVHFGKEKTNEIITSQKTIAHGYIDSGADFVIGSHAHTLQGIEIYKGAPIYYNLGNFLFSNYAVDTMVVNLTINEDNSVSTSILPCKAGQYKVREATGQEAKDIIKYVESISVNVKIDENGVVTEK